MAVVWALSWLILGAAGLVPASALAAFGMLAFMGVFAFGETLLQPTVPAIANDLASDHTRGRYNAISAGAFQAGAIAGPVVAGFLLEHDLAAPYIALMVLGCLAIGVMALRPRAADARGGQRRHRAGAGGAGTGRQARGGLTGSGVGRGDVRVSTYVDDACRPMCAALERMRLESSEIERKEDPMSVTETITTLAITADHWDGDGPPVFWPIFPILWFLFIVGRRDPGDLLSAPRQCEASPRRAGEARLAEMFAAGEISDEDYRTRRDVLREK